MDKLVSVKVNEEWLARLDRLAKVGEISRHQLIVNMMGVGVDQLRTLKQMGIIKLGLLIRDLQKPKPEASEDPATEKPIPVKLDEKMLAEIDLFAEQIGISRHQMMRNILHVCIEDLELLKNLGFVHMAKLADSLKGTFLKIFEDGKTALEAVQGGKLPSH